MDRKELAPLILTGIYNAIERGDQESLNKGLDILSLKQVDNKLLDEFIVELVIRILQLEQIQLIPFILHYFDQLDVDDTRIPTFVYLFTFYPMEDYLERLAKAMSTYTFFECVEELMNWDSNDKTRIAVERLLKVYQPQDIEALRGYIEKAYFLETGANIAVAETLERYVANLSSYAPKPEWIRDFTESEESNLPYEDELILPKFEEFPLPKLSLEEEVDLLIGGMEQIGLSLEEEESSRKQVKARLQELSEEQKQILLAPYLKGKQREIETENNRILFAILGPLNRQYGIDLTQEGRCKTYGGCRMFTCLCDTILDDEGDAVESEHAEWFTGYCEECLFRIKNKYWAVRIPMDSGGWKGCFCSWNCVRESSSQRNIVVTAMVDNIEHDMNIIGIQDRKMRHM